MVRAVSGLVDQALAAHVTRASALADAPVLPVADALSGLFVDGAIRRGTTVSVSAAPGGGSRTGATSLAMALVAGPSAAGSWVAVVGAADLGLAAMCSMGVVERRTALVPHVPTSSCAAVVSALVDGFDVVVVHGGCLGESDARRLRARVRERSSLLVVLSDDGRVVAGGSDLHLAISVHGWEGLGEGYGHLNARRASVFSRGRGAASVGRRVDLWLPGPDGTVAPFDGAVVHEVDFTAGRQDVGRPGVR